MKPKIKILFVQPNFHKYFVYFLPNYEPLVMLMLASLVNDIAEVQLFDRRFEPEKNLIKKIKLFKPDIIATRTHTSGEVFTAKRILSLAKQIIPTITTVLGGQHPSLLPDDFREQYIDLICIGRGEETFREIVQAYAENKPFETIPGLAINKNMTLFFTPERPINTNEFSWPPLMRSLANKHRNKYESAFTISSMGCPHRCIFCAMWVAARGVYNLRNVRNFVDDIERASTKTVYIGDDNTFHNYDHALAIYHEIKRRNIQKEYGAYARTDTIVEHPDIFEKWKTIGLKNLVVGFEVVSKSALETINKKTSIENNITAIEILHRLGIHNYAHFVIFPHFTHKDFVEVWDFCKKYKLSQPFFVPLTPLAGTPLFKEMKEKDQLSCFNYGFYNLEYMVCKTKLPKWLFYLEYILLWGKSLSPLTYIRMRKCNFPLQCYLKRLCMFLRAIFPYVRNIALQVIEEKKHTYEELEPTLLPSQRKDYTFRYLPKNHTGEKEE